MCVSVSVSVSAHSFRIGLGISPSSSYRVNFCMTGQSHTGAICALELSSGSCLASCIASHLFCECSALLQPYISEVQDDSHKVHRFIHPFRVGNQIKLHDLVYFRSCSGKRPLSFHEVRPLASGWQWSSRVCEFKRPRNATLNLLVVECLRWYAFEVQSPIQNPAVSHFKTLPFKCF